MSRHEGVSCDSCNKSNFRGKRYKCLICFDYDLCSACRDNGATTTRHTLTHPMQCIITRSDFELFYGGESLQFDQPSSYAFVCPHCDKLGLSETQLLEHVTAEHANTSTEVICPICAALPGGDPNHVTDDLNNHLTMEHRASSNRDLEEPLSRNIRRVFHPVRNIPPPRSRRTAQQLAASITSTSATINSVAGAAFSSARENIDPIAELLSQLSGVRRAAQQQSAATTASQLQLLQQQLQFERQQVQQARERLERLPRKQPTPPSTSVAVGGSNKQSKGDINTTAIEQSRYLLTQHYSENVSKEGTKKDLEERNERELFTKELLYSLLSPQFDQLKIENPANMQRIEKKKHEQDDKQCTQSVNLNEQFTEFTLVESNSSMNGSSSVCTGDLTSAHGSSSFTENLLLSKHCVSSDTVTFVSDEGDGNHNDTSVS